MRRELYSTLKTYLEVVPGVQHVALWNNNVIFIEEDEPWQRPAVFVEFLPIMWTPTKSDALVAKGAQFRLHIVTDFTVEETALEAFDLSKRIQAALRQMSDDCLSHADWPFDTISLIESDTNHDHEDLLETIDVYRYTGERLTARQYR